MDDGDKRAEEKKESSSSPSSHKSKKTEFNTLMIWAMEGGDDKGDDKGFRCEFGDGVGFSILPWFKEGITFQVNDHFGLEDAFALCLYTSAGGCWDQCWIESLAMQDWYFNGLGTIIVSNGP